MMPDASPREDMDEHELSAMPVDEIYRRIADFIVRAIDGEWVTATLYAEIREDDHGKTYGRYTTQQVTDESLYFRTDYTMYLAFDELRRRMRKAGEPPWTQAAFVLRRDGKFDVQLRYPDHGTRR